MDHTPRTSSYVRTTKATYAHIMRELNMQAQALYKLEKKIQNLCIYPTEIEYASTSPIQAKTEQYKTCAHILRELNMQAQ